MKEGIIMNGKVSMIKRINPERYSFEDVFDEFQTNNKIKSLSEYTIKSYQWNLRPLQQYMAENEIAYIDDINKNAFNQFILWLQEKHKNSTTINTYLRAARAFLYFSMSNDYMQQFKVNLIKDERKIKDIYTDQDILKLIAKPKNIKNCPFTEYRNWVMVNYFIETGNRLSTVISIKVEDIDLASGMVVLKATKNKKQMYYPLSSKLQNIIQEYLKVWGLSENSYLFPNQCGSQLKHHAIKKAITNYNKSRGVMVTSIHSFRHTFSKNFIMTSGDSLVLQKLLGHSSLVVTQNYVNLFDSDVAKDFEKHSILQRLTQNRIKREK
jgi:integrase/recombinase XerD